MSKPVKEYDVLPHIQEYCCEGNPKMSKHSEYEYHIGQ